MDLLHRAHAALSLHVTATRVGVRASTLRAWTEVGAGPAPDERGVYRRDVVTAWMQEMAAAVER